MTVLRLVAVTLILVVATLAWVILSGTVDYRTTQADGTLKEQVGTLWGQPQIQRAPTFTTRGGPADGHRVAIDRSRIATDLHLDQRRKGLLWYATYGVAFTGAYRVTNETTSSALSLRFPLPVPGADYDGFVVRVNGREVPTSFSSDAATARFPLAHGRAADVQVAYRTQGLDRWAYAQAEDGANAIQDFTLVVTTDFAAVDFPDGAVSPTSKRPAGTGWELTWRYDKLVSGRPIALEMPRPLNPGPVASRISLFAPVSLLFFFASLVLMTATRGVRLHPMNYAFLAAGFFAFHLLFSYLVDRVDLTWAFVAAALTSMALCTGYLLLVVGRTVALLEAAVGQLIFLVLFSYSFFFEGTTGLTVTIGAIITLAYFMLRTGGTDWDGVFRRERAYAPPPRSEPAPIFSPEG
jgi:hypothetical protein